jgi:DNA topoisomerase VI subunit B
MLRTFCSNPGLGGFGNESTIHSTNKNNDPVVVTPDAFCQIIKELVDNAVDACVAGMITTKNKQADKSKSSHKQDVTVGVDVAKTAAKRVRVVIERFMEQKDGSDDNHHNKELLKVTVSDNGCGMNNIQECVGAFHTSKSVYSTGNNADDAAASDQTHQTTNQTAGRYGIGLTLCLLHAQRLVPDSCASIQSATTTDRAWKVVSVLVDTASDTVRCIPRTDIPKSASTESGTAVSILVPVSEVRYFHCNRHFSKF